MKQVNERGIYFIFYMKVTFNMSNPEKNKHKVEKYTLSRSGVQRYFKNGKLYPTDLEIQTNLPSFKDVQQSDVEGNFSAHLARDWGLGPDLNVDATIPDDHRRVLKVISYVGCACSAIGLLLTILTVGLSRKLRRIRANQILLQLCIALLAAILLFVFGTQNVATDRQQEICKVLAAFLHYFLLSSIVWMSIQAYNLYQDIVKVFNTTTLTHTEFMIRASFVGWVIPGVIVMVTGLVKSTSYGITAIGNNTGTYKCWMDEYSFYGAFLAPVLLLMLLNTVAFVMVMREVVKIPHKQEKSKKMGHFKASLSIFVLLGLNWLFAGLAATDSSLVFWYLFTITCSFQGFLIFVMHGIIKKDFQEVWKALTYTNRVLDTLRASDQKTSSSALPQSSTAGRKTRSHSANGNDWDSGIDVHVNSTTRDNSAVDRPNGTRV